MMMSYQHSGMGERRVSGELVLEVTGHHGPPSPNSARSPLVDKVNVRLTSTGIAMGDRKLILAADIAGLQNSHENSIIVHAYPRKSVGCCGGVQRVKEEHMLYFSTPEEKHKVMEEWRRLLGRGKRGLRLLALVNPFSGTKRAGKLYKDVVQKIFAEAGAEVTTIITERMLHATEIVANADLSRVDGIVCVSGDGLVAEVANGLLQRRDAAACAKRVAIGFIPAGSGNGLAKSVLHNGGESCDALSAALAIVRGKVEPLDCANVFQRGQLSMRSILSFQWGLIADADILSDSLRWMGTLRFTVKTLQLTASKKLYDGTIRILGPPYGGHPCPINSSGRDACFKQSLEDGWIVIQGKFWLVWAMNCTHAAEDVHNAPLAKLNDGCFDVLMLTGDVSRATLLALFLAIENGTHINHKDAVYYKAREMIWEPGSQEGIVAMDGELICCGGKSMSRLPKCHQGRDLPMQYTPIQMKVERGALSCFSAASI